jgi:ornithine cyclodeaminase/alanine dehydrogenase-like protein (mu-crystallin family)
VQTPRQQPVSNPKFFDEGAVRAHLRMSELIDAMQRALVEFSSGKVLHPVRTVLEFGQEKSIFGLMPTYVPSLPALGAKLVTLCHENEKRGLHTHQAIIVMLDPETGIAKAVLDGRYITKFAPPPFRPYRRDCWQRKTLEFSQFLVLECRRAATSKL